MMNKFVYNLSVVFLVGAMVVSCQKQDTNGPIDNDKTIDVSLNIDFSEETDGYELAQTTRGELDEKAAFDFELVPTPKTRANTNVPDKLYNLEIRQYDASGNYLNGTHFGSTTKNIGEALTIPLSARTNCQLVIVAWGSNVSSSKTIGTGKLSSAMDTIYSADLIKNITPDAANMNGMPYVLHIKNVNVSGGYIQSGTGEVDARLRLKRLAALLTFNWTYNVEGYDLKQILLQSIPMDFRVIPNPDLEGNYPSLIDQFTTIQLTPSQIASGTYSCWVPANVRGNVAAANSITNRYKATAPQGSIYANFVATNKIDSKKKLDYRVYVGGTSVMNFDILANTNYTYHVNFSHVGVPLNDKRVTYIDPIPASQNNINFVPTANCFMVAPGGSFNFDPTKMRVNGSDVSNVYLTDKGWGSIKSVKLLWQTKENGDVGDPVIGVVNSDSDHSNIVEYNESLKRIYCRVAANTLGGNGVIAAYDGSGNILWSWHIWVTDYNPDPTGNSSVDNPVTKRKHKYTKNGVNQYPMMDRNLGANAGYTYVPTSEVERSKTNGFHYQWGRKDPFPSSYSEKPMESVIINSGKPTIGMLNLYKSDGVTFFQRKVEARHVPLQEAYRNPTSVFIAAAGSGIGNAIWCSDYESVSNPSYRYFWGMNSTKGFHDPCPAGWRIPNQNEFKHPLFYNIPNDDFSNAQTWPLNINNDATAISDGGIVLNFDDSGRTTYVRLSGYQQRADQFTLVGRMVDLWTRDNASSYGTSPKEYTSFAFCVYYGPGFLGEGNYKHVKGNWDQGDAHPVRCIQERP